MTLFSIREHAPGFGRLSGAHGRRGLRGARPSALAGFAEDIAILFRYAMGRDYYDRRLIRSDR